MVDGGRVGVTGRHVAAEREAVELVLPLRREELDLLHGPGLDPPADLLDPVGVGLGDRVVVQAGDRVPGRRTALRGRLRLRCVRRELGQVEALGAQAARAAQEALQVGGPDHAAAPIWQFSSSPSASGTSTAAEKYAVTR
ncbi:hypothetical protein GCM10009664_56980 [Kitasatospora gansuensis]